MTGVTEKRRGMEEFNYKLGELSAGVEELTRRQDTFEGYVVTTLKDVSEKLNWTYSQLKGNGKTTLEGFREEDRKHEQNLVAVKEEMREGFEKLSNDINDKIAPIAAKTESNGKKIFKIIATVGAVISVFTATLLMVSLFNKLQMLIDAAL